MGKRAADIARENRSEGEKTVIITGCSSGIGLATVQALAPNGWKVICAVRNPSKMQAVLDGEKDEVRNQCQVMKLDLASFASVREFASSITCAQLDAIICNAGFLPQGLVLTADGHEECFQASHLSHHLLVRLLEPKLATGSRVIFVSSYMHTFVKHGEVYDWPNAGKGEGNGFCSDEKTKNSHRMPIHAHLYAQAKIANVHDALEFGKRLSSKGVLVFSLHPGAVSSGFWKNGLLRVIVQLILPSSHAGAACSVYAATSAKLEDGYLPGMYLVPSFFNRLPHLGKVSKLGRDEAIATRLWEETEKLVSEWL